MRIQTKQHSLVVLCVLSTLAGVSQYEIQSIISQCIKNVLIYVTGFRKTDHIVTIDIVRNTDLKY